MPDAARTTDDRAARQSHHRTAHGSTAAAALPALWAAATTSPFLDGVRDGTLPRHALDRWLAQDALFVADLLVFQARLLARAPRSAQAVLAAGCTALVDELGWFEELAAERGLDLDAPPLPATLRYRELLERLDTTGYADAVRCLWAVEKVYLDAWTSVAPGAAAFADLVAHWTTPGFRSYVEALERLALDAGGGDDGLLGAVLRQEAAFWQAVEQGA